MTEVKCQCNIKLNPVIANNKQRRLQTTNNEVVDNILYESGALTMGLMVYYVASEFQNTFDAAPNALSSVEDTQRVLIVMTMFISLWSIGGFFIGFMFWKQLKMQTIATRLTSSTQASNTIYPKSCKDGSPLATTQMQTKLLHYVFSVVPTIFTNNAQSSFLLTLQNELRRHHIYWKLWSRSPTDRLPVLIVCQILTSHTLTFFLLAILYDFQRPDDDGSCRSYTTENACLHRKSLFDSTETYCKWTNRISPNITVDTQLCIYNDIDFSFEVMIYCAVVGSLFTAILMRPIDLMFSVLSSPLDPAAVNKIQPARSPQTREVNERRPTIQKMHITTQRRMYRNRSKFIPQETHLAHNEALHLINLLARSQSNRPSILGERLHNPTMIDDVETSRPPEHVMSEFAPSAQYALHSGVGALLESIRETRARLLQLSPQINELDLKLFDERWDLHAHGTTEYSVAVASSSLFFSSAEVISDEMECAQKDIRRIKPALRSVPDDEQRGIEILHLFVLDLLGRDTLEANIYRDKTNEDYTSLNLVGRREKVLCAIILISLNVFFFYFSILRGYQKGLHWQQIYLRTCIIQVLADILIFQTCECLYVNVFLPRLVSRKHLDDVRQVLESCIQQLCAVPGFQNSKSFANDMVNVPDYFFVSTNVAKAYPTLLESAIVLSYRSYLPNECLAQKWKKHQLHQEQQFSNDILSFIQKTPSFLISLAAIEIFGTIPIEIQRMFIRFIQPMVLSGAALTCLKIKEKYGLLYALLMLLGLATVIAVVFWMYFKYHAQDEQNTNLVKPINKEEDEAIIELATHPILLADSGEVNGISFENMVESLVSSSHPDISDQDFSLSDHSLGSNNLDGNYSLSWSENDDNASEDAFFSSSSLYLSELPHGDDKVSSDSDNI
jgi:hypothetical protein